MTNAGARYAIAIWCSGLLFVARPLIAQVRTDSVVGTAVPIDTSSAGIDTLRFVPDTQFTLAAAVALALRVGPQPARAAAGLDVAQAEHRTAAGAYLPSISLTAAMQRNGLSQTTATTVGTNPTGNPAFNPPLRPSIAAQTVSAPLSVATPSGFIPYATLALGWDVFTAGRRPADVQRARADMRAAQSGDIQIRFQVLSDVKTAFFNLLRAEDLQAVANAQIRRAQEDVHAAARRHDVGTATPSDVLQFELNLANARQALVQAMIDQRSSAFALGRLAGVQGSAGAVREGPLEPTPLALPDTAIVSLALRASPALLAARDSAEAARAAVASARTQYVPTIRAAVSYTAATDSIVLGGVRSGWAFSIGTIYPLFNGFQREFQVQQAAATSDVASAVARDAERAARANAQQLLGNVALTAREVALARGAVTVAREYYRVQSSRFAVGVATVLDLSTAEQNLTQAEQQLVNARYNYQLARASLETLVGRNL